MTKMLRRSLLQGAVVALAFAGTASAQDKPPIKIGEINSYTALAAFTQPYRKGMELALSEINASGGVLGRKLEVVFRDDAFKPADALRHAEELVRSEKVDLLAGTFASSTGLAVAEFANQNKVLFVAAEPLTDALVWDKGSRYVFRLRPSTHMQAAMLVEEAAKLPAKRWATVAPNYEYGTSFVTAFKKQLSAVRPDIVWVGEQWPAQGKLEAGPTVDALDAMKPEAIFNATFGPDLARFVREGNTRGLFERRSVVSALTGEPEYIDPLKEETPVGWIVTGYPWQYDDRPEQVTFRDAYQKATGEHPRLGSLVGYITIKSIAAGIAKAGSTDTEAMIQAMRGLELGTPLGPILWRAGDHQSTMGAYVGVTGIAGSNGVMLGWRYAEGAKYLPPEAEATKLRPADANR
jgi:branched-chain amino acid transport system substrate-binding protein